MKQATTPQMCLVCVGSNVQHQGLEMEMGMGMGVGQRDAYAEREGVSSNNRRGEEFRKGRCLPREGSSVEL